MKLIECVRTLLGFVMISLETVKMLIGFVKIIIGLVRTLSGTVRILIEVVNILGEVIDTRAVIGSINETFDMTSFSAGMYFVKSSNGTSESTQRIIIK